MWDLKIVKKKLQSIGTELKEQIQILAAVTLIFWVVFIIDRSFWNGNLSQFGIMPHRLIGLRGILFAPFLHGNYYHIASNTASFLVLGWMVMLRNTNDFYFVSVFTAIASGLGTWLVGSPSSVHIGASGVIFGYFGYLLSRGYFEKSFVAIAISITIAMSYGSLIWGILPTRSYISWEGHLFGFIGGVLAARILAAKTKIS